MKEGEEGGEEKDNTEWILYISRVDIVVIALISSCLKLNIISLYQLTFDSLDSLDSRTRIYLHFFDLSTDSTHFYAHFKLT
jgi:hypothetical protein